MAPTAGNQLHNQSSKMSGRTPKQKATEKTHTHRLILAQFPLWILPVLLVMQTGVLCRWSDAEYLVFSLGVAAPSVLLPYFLISPPRSTASSLPYWLKLHVWVAVLVCFGTYFGTHYFFDLMGMRYAFASATWHLESDVVGRSGQVVPLFMYPLTHAYFMSYFVFLVVAERRLRSLSGSDRVGRGLLVVALAYGVAFAETYVMASPLLEDLFRYDDRERMLRVGSLGYASYFVVGLPMVKRIDRAGEEWGIGRVVIEALATCMGILVLLEVWAKVVGPL
ncbi:Cycloeucalenol cycloisomerase [Madurella fahalii]|uniref:Cycloeucalenol cycloisomerase n=1 Tax=Madurella fahalii TaxID=1157608 RepID=A0ABQ0GHE1_9PEZI